MVDGRRPRLVDKAYRVIRDDLITLRIEPGAALDEKKLSASLNVGLTPVRDAIKRLTLERLLVTYPRRGTFAAEINISDERWLTEARTGLEGLAALLAAQRASHAERAVLIELAEKLEGSKLSMANIDHDADVHRAIYAAAHQTEVVAAIVARDGERARAAAEAHLLDYSTEIRRLLRLDPQAGASGP
jgi:DNA-binding GntR family transcriptional regulator